MNKDELGACGETLAADYLETQGWDVVDRNVITKFGEIDIVAEKMVLRGEGRATLVIFVEVKTRRPRRNLRPEMNVTRGKRERITRLAKWWMGRRNAAAIGRFDIIAIEWPYRGDPVLRHFEGAFDALGRLN